MLNQLLSPQARQQMVSERLHARRAAAARPPDQTLLEWTLKNRPLLAPARPFRVRPHLVDLYQDDCREMVVYKAAQLGVSELLICWALYVADMKNATVLYLFPTDTHVSDFSASRLGSAIDPNVSPYLASIIVGGGEHGADRVGLKRVHDRFLYFRGGQVKPDGRAPQLHSIDADALVLDEFDQMDPRVAPIARERLEASAFAQVRFGSTPTYAEMGIHAEYLASDQRQWHIPCAACGKLQAPTLDDLVVEWDKLGRPVHWNGERDATPFLRCRACGGTLDREGGAGEWVAQYPHRAVHGYHLFRLSLPGKPLQKILDDLDTVNETKRQQAYNQGLGLTYTPSSAMAMTDSVLDLARRDYGMGLEVAPPNFAGIDVGRVLHMVIRGTLPNGERPLVFAGAVDSFEDAARLLRQFNVVTCVIDALPETRAARAMAQALPRFTVWIAYYADGGETTKKEAEATWDVPEGKVLIDRTRSLDAMFASLYDAANGGIGSTLPANARDLRDYYTHLKAPKRILQTDAKGQQTAVYLESGPDHYAHAENYCAVARLCPFGNFIGLAQVQTDAEQQRNKWIVERTHGSAREEDESKDTDRTRSKWGIG